MTVFEVSTMQVSRRPESDVDCEALCRDITGQDLSRIRRMRLTQSGRTFVKLP
jgi:hypothetical protein